MTLKVLTRPATGELNAGRVLGTHAINLSWVLRLRWSALAGQALTAAVVHFGLGVLLPLPEIGAILVLAALTNVGAHLGSRRFEPHESWLFALMTFDVVALTALLYLTGGPSNPFSFLYLVPIALATLVLRPLWTWMLVLLSLIGSAFLFVAHRPIEELEMHAEHMKTHLRGMWVAFGVAAGFIVYFLLRLRRALAARDQALAASREVVDRQQRLASLATLAAGAAHELATPLGTIAVVSRELVSRSKDAGTPESDDLALIRSEVERCRAILTRMSYATRWRDHGGQGVLEEAAPEETSLPLPDLLARARASLRSPTRLTVSAALLGDEPPAGLGVDEAFVQALGSALRNAEDASPPSAEVALSIELRDDAAWAFTVKDAGRGMTSAELARVGEPFFTTKEPGRGMGLGLFLARAVVERLGGSLTLESEPGQGTTVTFEVPLARARA